MPQNLQAMHAQLILNVVYLEHLQTWQDGINCRGDQEEERLSPDLIAVKEDEVHKEKREGGTAHALHKECVLQKKRLLMFALNTRKLVPDLEAILIKQEAKDQVGGPIHDTLDSSGDGKEGVIRYVQHGITLVVGKEEVKQSKHGQLKYYTDFEHETQ